MNTKIDGQSMDVESEALERLWSVFPECFIDGELDVDKLLMLCGKYKTNDFEKYKFEWHGKNDSMKLAQRRSTACIEGDNLEVLKLLQTAYFRQVER